MKIPRGAMGHGKRGKVCRLLKGMYGLKQAGRGWHQELMKVFVQDMKFIRSEVDHLVFYKKGIEEHTIIAVATDDMIVTSQQIVNDQEFKSQVQKRTDCIDQSACVHRDNGIKIQLNRHKAGHNPDATRNSTNQG